MDLQSWAAFAAILGALVANFALMSSKFAKLDAKVDRVRDELRAEVRDGFRRVDGRLDVLEQRTYDLSVRLPPAPSIST